MTHDLQGEIKNWREENTLLSGDGVWEGKKERMEGRRKELPSEQVGGRSWEDGWSVAKCVTHSGYTRRYCEALVCVCVCVCYERKKLEKSGVSKRRII